MEALTIVGTTVGTRSIRLIVGGEGRVAEMAAWSAELSSVGTGGRDREGRSTGGATGESLPGLVGENSAGTSRMTGDARAARAACDSINESDSGGRRHDILCSRRA